MYSRQSLRQIPVPDKVVVDPGDGTQICKAVIVENPRPLRPGSQASRSYVGKGQVNYSKKAI